MIIRQSYLDATSGKRHIKEVEIHLEDSRNPNSSIFSQANILASCGDHLLSIGADEEILTLLDNKRTFVPPNVIQTHLTAVNNQSLTVTDTAGFHTGDPIVIMSDRFGNNQQFAMISAINENTITIINLSKSLSVGTIVQNLANRVWIDQLDGTLGINAYLARPESLPFQLALEHGKVNVHVTTPISPGTIRYYDIYIKQSIFNKIESGWLAELQDIEIKYPSICLSTCDKIPLIAGSTYFVGVVAKDAKGNINVNESACFVETFVAI